MEEREGKHKEEERRNAVSFFSNIEKREKEGEDQQATKSCFNLLTN